MANWWDSAPVVEQAPPAAQKRNWWDDAPVVNPSPPNLPPPSAAPQESQAYRGTILPFSKDEQGNVSFDSDAGILGAAKRAFMLPSQVYQGEIDPNSDEAIGRALEFATVASPMNPAIRAGERIVPGVAQNLVKQQVDPPTAEALKDAARSGYDQVRDASVDYSAKSVNDLASGLRTTLERDGILEELAPKSFRVLGRLEQSPEGAVAPISGIEAARRSFNHAAKDFSNPTDQEAARRIVSGLDEFVEAADPATVVAGPAAGAAKTLQDARSNYAAAKRSETLAGIENAAEIRTGASNSGQNLDNATRQRLASLLLNPKAIRGFNDSEREAIRQVTQGVPGANALRTVGNILGGGGGLGALHTGVAGVGAGGYLGGVPGAIAGAVAPALGWAAKQGSAHLTQKAFGKVDAATRSRSALYETLLADAPMTAATTGRYEALIRALTATGAAPSETR